MFCSSITPTCLPLTREVAHPVGAPEGEIPLNKNLYFPAHKQYAAQSFRAAGEESLDAFLAAHVLQSYRSSAAAVPTH